MNKRSSGFGGGCMELGIVASVFVSGVVFVIVLAVKLHAGITLAPAVFKALFAAALAFGMVALFWILAFVAIYLLPRNKG